jgi:hypothetical protein
MTEGIPSEMERVMKWSAKEFYDLVLYKSWRAHYQNELNKIAAKKH